MPIRYSCRHCHATSYKQVIQRDDHGQMRPSGLFKCSGCSVVFADPQAWRQAESDTASAGAKGVDDGQRVQTGAPNFKTGWMCPPGPA